VDKDIKAEWIKRLRSGVIQQVRGRLGTPDGKRCCLGVLCDIAVEQKVIEEPTASVIAEGYIGSGLVYGHDAQTLPISVMRWAGLEDANPSAPIPDANGDEWTTLAELNDTGMSFADIADIIEREL
jgi:hypothetical protein